MRCLSLGFVSLVCCLAAEPRLAPLLKSVEARYNGAQSLKLSFSQTYLQQHRPEQHESGLLTLRKPGRMRWDYLEPAGKVFVSDGKRVSLYNPETNQVEISSLKETDDLRAPLAFLLGKLDFSKEFQNFALKDDADGTWISADPKRDSVPYTRVEFLVAPDGRIRRLKVVAQDRSVLDFRFEQERLNPPVELSLFQYRPPTTAQVVAEEEK